MVAYDPHRSFGLLVHDLARLLRKRFERQSQGTCLTRAQWSVLVRLSRQEGIRQADLADLMEIEPITLVRLLDRLQRLGVVERRHDPDDRRVRRLFLTPKAKPLLDQGAELALAVRREALDGLSDAQAEALIDTLLHIKGNLLRLDAEPLPEPGPAGPADGASAGSGGAEAEQISLEESSHA